MNDRISVLQNRRIVKRAIRTAGAVTAVLLLARAPRAGAVILGQMDNFQDGTVENWSLGALSGPSVVSTGGPAGASDQFMEVMAFGGDGPGSKLVTFNRTQWVGNYATAGVNLISMDLKDFANTTLSIRVAFKDATAQGGAGYSSTTPFIVAADGAWHHATFALLASAMTAVNSPAESFNTLIGTGTGPAEFRILDSNSPASNGDVITADLGIDNITALSSGPTITSATWNAASGNWEDGSKWLGGVPAYGANQTATFPDPTGTAPVSATVTLTANEMVGNLAFIAASKGSYNFVATGGSTLTFNGSGSSIHLVSSAGNVTLAAPLIFASTVTATTDGSTTLTIAGGITGTGGLNKAGTGSLAIAAPSAGAGISPLSLSSITVTAGTLSLNSSLSHSDRTLLISSGLSIASARLDLGGNDAIVHGGNLGSIQTLVQAGYSNGSWNGPGPSIISSLAHFETSHLSAVGMITGATTFDNRAVLTTDVLLKYTNYGDANLDGKVDASDYSRIDSGYLAHATGWANGDFNYDGMVNGSDYTLIDNAFNRQGVSLAASIADHLASTNAEIASIAAVPEPSTLALSGFCVAALRRRGRARRAVDSLV